MNHYATPFAKWIPIVVTALFVLALIGCEDMAKPEPPQPPQPPAVDLTPKEWTVQAQGLADWPEARATVDGEERIGGDAIANAIASQHRPDVGPVDGDTVTIRFTAAWSTTRTYGALFRNPAGWGVERFRGGYQLGRFTATVDSGADWATARKVVSGKVWIGGNAIVLAVVYDNRPDHGPIFGDVVTVNSAPGTVPAWSVTVLYDATECLGC